MKEKTKDPSSVYLGDKWAGKHSKRGEKWEKTLPRQQEKKTRKRKDD